MPELSQNNNRNLANLKVAITKGPYNRDIIEGLYQKCHICLLFRINDLLIINY